METKFKDQQWAVTIDRPYYPSIEYFATEAEAVSAMDAIKFEQDDGPEAAHLVTVCVVKIVYAREMRTHF